MDITFFQIDAFTSEIFSGNPAAVCPLDAWLPEETLQNIAAENNLSETAYFVKEKDGFRLRWFTPIAEVNLCGHATLASAFVLFNLLDYKNDSIVFYTKSGTLTVVRDGTKMVMDFPMLSAEPCDIPKEITSAFNSKPLEVWKSEDYMVVFENEADIAALKPDFYMLKKLNCRGIIATAKGDNTDFVSRFFAPRYGIDEDPVTGSAHCLLAPYWSKRLKKTVMQAKQISQRGGQLTCKLEKDRVLISGEAVIFLTGIISI